MRPQRPLERLKHHALAVLFVLIAFGLTLALQAVADRAYYILFCPGSHVCRVVRRACGGIDG